MRIALSIAVLTAVLLTAIIVKRRQKKILLRKILSSQSSIHRAFGDFLPTNSELRKKKKTQTRNHHKDTVVKVIRTSENKVYWVANNTFYCVASTDDGDFDPAEAKPINTDNLTKEDIEKLLFILDNLNGD